MADAQTPQMLRMKAMRHAYLRQVQMRQQQQKQQQEQQGSSELSAGMNKSSLHKSQPMGSALDDIPIQTTDYNFLYDESTLLEAACREGLIREVQSTITSERSTPRFLHCGLLAALRAGKVQDARYLLSAGAVISRAVPPHILAAPQDQRIPLFELFAEYGWTPNTPAFYGEVLLPRVITDLPLLRWFLSHGAMPNLGTQRDNRDRMGLSETDSCDALQAAAEHGTLEAVRLLLDAGAQIDYGSPLHCAAEAHPEGMNIYHGPVHLTREFDLSRIPIMELLVKHGADVNQRDESRHMVPRLPILLAAMAGAVERVRWLLEHGADPEADWTYGSAVSHANKYGSEEMKRVIEEGVKARRWVKTQDSNGNYHLRTGSSSAL